MSDPWRLTNITCPQCGAPLLGEIEKYTNECGKCAYKRIIIPITDAPTGVPYSVAQRNNQHKEQVSGSTDNPAIFPIPKKTGTLSDFFGAK